MTRPRRVVLTSGEPAGIGPDLAIMVARRPLENTQIITAGNESLLRSRAEQLNSRLKIRPFSVDDRKPAKKNEIILAGMDLAVSVEAGVPNPDNASYVLRQLDFAVQGCLSGIFHAMCTGPVHKGVINDAGIKFSGHTEYLARKTQSYPLMMLAAGDFRVALATTHLPLSRVAQSITKPLLHKVIGILDKELREKFNLDQPEILVCGLNPHAGEGGHMGREEIEILIPVIKELNRSGLRLIGPLPADTLFTPQHLATADAVLAMYHDQGLPVLKYAGFGKSVNITLGLPIVRTSVDHGTALELAGSGNIDPGSLRAALQSAVELSDAEK